MTEWKNKHHNRLTIDAWKCWLISLDSRFRAINYSNDNWWIRAVHHHRQQQLSLSLRHSTKFYVFKAMWSRYIIEIFFAQNNHPLQTPCSLICGIHFDLQIYIRPQLMSRQLVSVDSDVVIVALTCKQFEWLGERATDCLLGDANPPPPMPIVSEEEKALLSPLWLWLQNILKISSFPLLCLTNEKYMILNMIQWPFSKRNRMKSPQPPSSHYSNSHWTQRNKCHSNA